MINREKFTLIDYIRLVAYILAVLYVVEKINNYDNNQNNNTNNSIVYKEEESCEYTQDDIDYYITELEKAKKEALDYEDKYTNLYCKYNKCEYEKLVDGPSGK